MALGKVEGAVIKPQRTSRIVSASSSRYSSCDLVTEDGRTRLGFKRYSDYDAGEYSTSVDAEVAQSAEARVDIMAKTVYNDPLLIWPIFMFNRLKTWNLNPFRFRKQTPISIPSLSMVAQRLRSKVVGND